MLKHFYQIDSRCQTRYVQCFKNMTPKPLITLPQSHALKNHTKPTHMQDGYNNKYIQLSSIHSYTQEA